MRSGRGGSTGCGPGLAVSCICRRRARAGAAARAGVADAAMTLRAGQFRADGLIQTGHGRCKSEIAGGESHIMMAACGRDIQAGGVSAAETEWR